MLYVPTTDDDHSHLCWARIWSQIISEYSLDFGDSIVGKGERLVGITALEEAGIMIGDRYLRRLKEENGQFVPVQEFCSQQLIDALAENPEALPSVSSDDFEQLCAEIFARRGFKVDLFRRTGDGGIDFLAVQDERTDPTIFAVQVKQPQERAGKARRSVGRPVVQQIYGAAKAWDMKGGIVVSGSTYSQEAKTFAEIKPEEMKVHDGKAVLEWIMKYRWNEDELA
ncbi:restriction endonuclease [Mesorhizobium sp. B2-9-1]|uniref:restriction endonuclease n=1 Tax=Mesorhizobium sp. B2-9-1 TaxID=2589898 RepID=UPI0015E3CFCE|nr:restriction endonuclease [Mesorhizobium sp. B2-9-1]